MQKKLSKVKIKRSSECTSKIFEQCIREVLGTPDWSEEDLHNGMDIIRHARLYSDIYDTDELKEMLQAKESVDNLYQQKISELSTKQLQEILEVHESGALKRTGRTINTILSELARRSILDDSNQSDLISNNGVVDGRKSKSKLNSKKTTSKRNKAYNGR